MSGPACRKETTNAYYTRCLLNAKRPPRSPAGASSTETPSTGQRRPALPRAYPAVPSARCGLASGFGMGPGVPRTLWPLTGGRRSAHPGVLACPEGRTATTDRMARPGASRSGDARARERAGRPAARCGVRARAISTARLRGSHPLHLPPIEPVVYRCPYRKEN